jgi:hypothetical protein
MEVRTDCIFDPAALVARVSIVSEARHDLAEGRRTVVENRPAGVVLEASGRPALAGFELALDEDISDHAALAGNRMQGKDARTRLISARAVAVEPTEQLIAAAHRKYRRSVCHGLGECGATCGQIWGHERLLAVLPAADVVEIGVRRQLVTEPDRPHDELDATPPRALGEHREVAPVRVDVEVLGVQMRDDNVHAARFQYGFA